jgi:hypothetical protein
MIDLGQWLTSINSSKEDLMASSDDQDVTEKDYNPYIINRLLSYHPDAILYVNEINYRPGLTKGQQYKYLLHSLRQKKRFGKWQKPEKLEDIDVIKEYYNYSDQKAKIALKILTQYQIEAIKESMLIGGKKK